MSWKALLLLLLLLVLFLLLLSHKATATLDNAKGPGKRVYLGQGNDD